MRDTAKLVMESADPSNLMSEADAEQRLRDDADAAIAAESMLPAPVTQDWAAPTQGVSDPGCEDVATPGSAPEPAVMVVESTPAPPPPPPPPPGWVPLAERPAVGLAGAEGTVAP
jgi:hypothetical protein